MSEIDELIRSALREREQGQDHDQPTGSVLLDQIRSSIRRHQARKRAWLVGAGAGVVALAMGGTLVAVNAASNPATVASQTTSGGPSAAAALVGAPPKPGMRYVSFHGVQAQVPAGWATNAVACGTAPRQNTVIVDQGTVATCLMEYPGNGPVYDTASFMPARTFAIDNPTTRLTAGTLDGMPVKRATMAESRGRERGVLELTAQGVVIDVTARQPRVIDEILASVRVVTVDHNGCPSTAPGLYPAGGGGHADTASALVPGSPSSAALCHYASPTDTAPAPRDPLGHSTGLGSVDTARLAELMNGLAPGLRTSSDVLPAVCPSFAQDFYLVRFYYRSGPPVDIYLHMLGCDHLGADNGSRTGGFTDRFGMAFAALDGPYGQSFQGGF
jgi:hypothetical protein